MPSAQTEVDWWAAKVRVERQVQQARLGLRDQQATKETRA